MKRPTIEEAKEIFENTIQDRPGVVFHTLAATSFLLTNYSI
jgi:hypothetical protein